MKTELNSDQLMCLNLYKGYRNIAKVARAMNVKTKEMKPYFEETFQTIAEEMGIMDVAQFRTPKSKCILIQAFFDKIKSSTVDEVRKSRFLTPTRTAAHTPRKLGLKNKMHFFANSLLTIPSTYAKSHAMINIPKQITVWMDAHRSIPDYAKLYSYVVARAGEGEQITAEDLNMHRRSFAFDKLMLLTVPGSYVVYSMDEATGELDVELISNYIKGLK